MDSDVDMDVDAVTPSAFKGKEKAVTICADGDTLPWYVPRSPRLLVHTFMHYPLQGREIPAGDAQRCRFP